jgi:hypothetical protein
MRLAVMKTEEVDVGDKYVARSKDVVVVEVRVNGMWR